MKLSSDARPLARKEHLVIKEAADELLIYDRERDTAHCLNQTAALVWRYCDGKRSVTAITNRISQDLRAPVDENIVWYAVEQLGRDHLLQERLTPPSLIAGMNRREMIRALGLAAVVAVPVVTSIVAPTPAQAATCLDPGVACIDPAQCCSNICSGTCA
jgi:coenzyme PQQ synthesis protein D (PqqD)